MEGWEGQIDVDDSDLQSVLRPQLLHSSCPPHAILNRLEPCSQISSSFQTLDRIPSIPPFQSQLPTNVSEINQNEEEEHPKLSISRPLIPGPAGAIQAAMRRRSAAASSKRLLPEEEGSDDLDLCVNEEDGDFKLNPWLYSLSFLGQSKDSNLPYPISLINAQRSATQRIPQVVGIVKSCTPNGLGDFSITLKDPTGTIGAAIHRKVLSEGNICREISVGCVFILKQVVALCPAHSSCYLNITLKNVVKVPLFYGVPFAPLIIRRMALLTLCRTILQNFPLCRCLRKTSAYCYSHRSTVPNTALPNSSCADIATVQSALCRPLAMEILEFLLHSTLQVFFGKPCELVPPLLLILLGKLASLSSFVLASYLFLLSMVAAPLIFFLFRPQNGSTHTVPKPPTMFENTVPNNPSEISTMPLPSEDFRLLLQSSEHCAEYCSAEFLLCRYCYSAVCTVPPSSNENSGIPKP
ncbi:hypothetical protein M5K25_011175 [Dendrobium thyrsiflorum]|uniref:Homologous recombination OB-fold protein OB-fold domain-containing protein n=1 Tax=Dendrobium thyrsiflorum TaxID=117978 RepID=A0ABD0V974_DENTH